MLRGGRSGPSEAWLEGGAVSAANDVATRESGTAVAGAELTKGVAAHDAVHRLQLTASPTAGS